jgi:uncharacterized protein
MTTEVTRNDDASRYELRLDGELVGIADYDGDGDVLVFPHTEIDPRHRGRGLGDLLVGAALDDVRRRGAKVVPTCWFVRDFIDAREEYRTLVA